MIVKQIADKLNQAKRVVLASHFNPEGDAIGSILALAVVLDKLGKETWLYNRDGVPFNLKFLPGMEKFHKELPAWQPDTVVIADCGEFNRIGDEGESRLKSAPLIINIDHHGTNTNFGHLNWVLPKMASTGEMICELIDAMDAQWTPEIATCIYTTVVTDTGAFQFGNTNINSFRVAARMVEYGANPAMIAQRLFFDMPVQNLRLLCRVLSTLKIEAGGKIATVEVTRNMFDETDAGPDATEGFVDYPRMIRGVDVAILLREKSEGEYKISMRSKGGLDVAKVAEKFSGGGHAEAAGCTVKGTLGSVRETVIAEVRSRMSL